MKTVYRASNITEAEIIRGMLAAEGIDCHVSGFYLQGGIGELAAADNARIMVEDSDLQRAMNLIQEYDPQTQVDDDPEPDQDAFLAYFVGSLLLVIMSTRPAITITSNNEPTK